MRERTERLAYRLWQDAGCPEGQADRFWREAEAQIAAEPAAPEKPAPLASDPPPPAAGMVAPLPDAPRVGTGWRAAAARYVAAWWAHPAKPADR